MNNFIKGTLIGAVAAFEVFLATTGVTLMSAEAGAAANQVGAAIYFPDTGDSGHGGIWADDNFYEAMVVTNLGSANPANCNGNSPCFKFSATATDNGSFGTRDGAGTPNQVVPGRTITGHVPGSMTGKLGWGTFYADTLPLASRVQTQVNNHGTHVDGQTGAMINQFFPHTVVGGVTQSDDTFGLSLSTYDFEYAAKCFPSQHWSDTSSNGDGNLAGDGNVTGGRSCVQVK